MCMGDKDAGGDAFCISLVTWRSARIAWNPWPRDDNSPGLGDSCSLASAATCVCALAAAGPAFLNAAAAAGDEAAAALNADLADCRVEGVSLAISRVTWRSECTADTPCRSEDSRPRFGCARALRCGVAALTAGAARLNAALAVGDELAALFKACLTFTGACPCDCAPLGIAMRIFAAIRSATGFAAGDFATGPWRVVLLMNVYS